MQDVWIVSDTEPDAPDWVKNQYVREGINHIRTKDRCIEEKARLRKEAINFSLWYHHQLILIEIALRSKKPRGMLSTFSNFLKLY